MKNIAFINYSAEMGGAEHSLLTLLKNINREQFHPYVIHTKEGSFIREVKLLKIDTIYIPLDFNIDIFRRNNIWRLFFKYPKVLYKIYKWRAIFRNHIRKHSINCIHANQPKSHILAMLSAGKGIKYILHLRDIFPNFSIPWFLYLLLFSTKNGNAIAISKAVARSYPKKLNKKTSIIYNGTNIPKPQENIKTEIKRPCICSIGRLVPWKGFDILIKAFSRVTQKHPDVFLYIIGDSFYWNDSYKNKLIKLAKSLKLDKKVIFTGYKKNISDYLFACDFMVLASKNEPFGRVLIEAMAHRKPVIALKSGGVPEIVIPNQTGILVNKQTASEFSTAITYLLDNNEKAIKMGIKGKERVEKMFLEKDYANKIEQLLSKTIEFEK